MPATQQDRQGLDELRDAHRKRLRQLQIQAARMGDDTPPHVVIEIEQIEGKLAQLEAAAQAVAAAPVDPDIADALGPAGRFQLINVQFYRIDSDISDLKKEVRSLHEKFDQILIDLFKERRRRPRSPRRATTYRRKL